VFYHMRQWSWSDAATWATAEYKLDEPPSRSSMYRFYSAMRPLENAHLIESSINRARKPPSSPAPARKTR